MPSGHESRSNETDYARTAETTEAFTPPPSPLSGLSKVEVVPGYQPRGLAESSLTPDEVVPSGDEGPAVDAAAASFRSVATLEVVIGDDDRTVVPDTRLPPWRFTCALRIKSGSGRRYVGTGWFIGPKTLVTAGHCVYIHDEGGWVESIEVIPALNGASRPFGSAVARSFRAVAEWTDHRNSDFDYGAIILDTPLGARTGWFGFAALEEARLFSVDINISGYPADREQASRQFFHARKITRASSRKLYYEVDTYGGQSGSATFLNLNSERVAVGIHTTGASTGNSGTLINREVFENLKLWKNG